MDRSAILAAVRAGKSLRGADLRGAVGLVELPAADPRGYRLVAVLHGGDWVLTSGCRGPWTVAECRAHWGAEEYDGDPLTAQRYLHALEWWEQHGEPYRVAASARRVG